MAVTDVAVQALPQGAGTPEATVALVTRLARPNLALAGSLFAVAARERLPPFLEVEAIVKWGEHLASHVQRRAELPPSWLDRGPPAESVGAARLGPPDLAAYFASLVDRFEAVTVLDLRPVGTPAIKLPATTVGVR